MWRLRDPAALVRRPSLHCQSVGEAARHPHGHGCHTGRQRSAEAERHSGTGVETTAGRSCGARAEETSDMFPV